MVSDKKQVNVYLPEELYQALAAYQEQLGFEEPSAAVIEILTQFFHKGGFVKRYATVEQLETVEGKVTNLSKQIAQLYKVITSATPTEAGRTVSTFNEYTHPNLTAQQSSASFVGTSLVEDEDDEPDEILYDFLEPGSHPPSSRQQ